MKSLERPEVRAAHVFARWINPIDYRLRSFDGKDAFIERMRGFDPHSFACAEPVRYTIGKPEH